MGNFLESSYGDERMNITVSFNHCQQQGKLCNRCCVSQQQQQREVNKMKRI